MCVSSWLINQSGVVRGGNPGALGIVRRTSLGEMQMSPRFGPLLWAWAPVGRSPHHLFGDRCNRGLLTFPRMSAMSARIPRSTASWASIANCRVVGLGGGGRAGLAVDDRDPAKAHSGPRNARRARRASALAFRTLTDALRSNVASATILSR